MKTVELKQPTHEELVYAVEQVLSELMMGVYEGSVDVVLGINKDHTEVCCDILDELGTKGYNFNERLEFMNRVHRCCTWSIKAGSSGKFISTLAYDFADQIEQEKGIVR